MQFLKKDPIDPDLYMRVYQVGYGPQQHTNFSERLRAVLKAVPVGRILRYWPLLVALVLGIAAGIEIASSNRAPVVLQARSTDVAPLVRPPLERSAVMRSPVQATPPVITSVQTSLTSVPVPVVTRALVGETVRTKAIVEKAPVVEQRPRNNDLAALMPMGSKSTISASTAPSKVLPPPSMISLNSVPETPNWTPLPQITIAPPPPPTPAKIGAPLQRPVAPADLHVSDPQPLQKVMPGRVSSGVILYRDLDVQIKVTVGADGRVTDARPLPNIEKVDQSRTGAAVVAARQWLFQPATLRGQAIASDYIIVFRFHARQ